MTRVALTMSGSWGVDEHKWKHVRGDGTPGFVTVIVDLTPQVDGTGPARLLDKVPGRSADAFGDWLADRPQRFRDTVKTVTMDGYSGYTKAASEQVSKPGRRWIRSMSWIWPPGSWICAVSGSRTRRWVTGAGRVIRCTGSAVRC